MILANFVRACNILVCRSLSKNGLEEAHRRLLSMAKLIEENYGPKKISPNLHLCLHICECALDYGPIYAFWCFSYERMNGLLGNYNTFIYQVYRYFIGIYYFAFIGSFHSSNRNIEPELLKTIQYNSLIDQLSSHAQENHNLSACLPLIEPKKATGSLGVHNEVDYREFLSMSRNVETKAGTGTEAFPGEFLSPKKMNSKLSDEVLDLLIQYYRNAYGKDFVALSNINVHNVSSDFIPVLPNANLYGRLQLGSEVFGSAYSKRHISSAKILSQFVTNNNDKNTYPGIVQFYFEHTVDFKSGPEKHSLAFVRWFLPAGDHKTRFHCKVGDDYNSCNIELWRKEFFELSRDCIIPIHSILGRFVEGSFSIGKRKPRKYMSVIPINRKMN
jgi:hypothetical protein